RQMVSAVRNLKGLVFVFILFAFMMLPPLLVPERPGAGPAMIPWVLVLMIFVMTLMLWPMLAFDFRGDIDRMEVLKALPIAPAGLVAGQVLTPALITTLLQWVGLTIVEMVQGVLGPLFWAALAFAPPFNFLLYEIVNLWFLWFPTRMIPGTAGDFQMM